MAPKKLKPYRVSYYFADAIVNGKARLWTRYLKATTAGEAKATLERVFASAPGKLVIVKAYLHYKAPVFRPKKSVFVNVPDVIGAFTDGSPLTAPTRFTDEPCPFHPDAILEADGRCPALDPGYNKPVGLTAGNSFPVGPCTLSSTATMGGVSFTVNTTLPAGVATLTPLPAQPGFIPDAELDPKATSAPLGYVPLDDCSGVVQEPGLQPIDNASVPEPDSKDAQPGKCDDPECEICGTGRVLRVGILAPRAEADAAIDDILGDQRSEYDRYRDDIANQDGLTLLEEEKARRPVPVYTLVILFASAFFVVWGGYKLLDYITAHLHHVR